MLQPKDTDWLNGYKHKACIKRSTLDLGTHADWKWGSGKNIFHVNGNQKSTAIAILISDEIYFKIKSATRDEEGHYITIKRSIQKENIIFVSIYVPNIGAPQYIRQMLRVIKGEINSNTKIVGNYNTPLTAVNRIPRQKFNKESQVLNDTLD